MPEFTINVSDAQLPKLQAVVTAYNGNTGQALTVQQWLDLHVKEIAIAEDLGAAVTAIQRQQEEDAQQTLKDATTAARDQLLAKL